MPLVSLQEAFIIFCFPCTTTHLPGHHHQVDDAVLDVGSRALGTVGRAGAPLTTQLGRDRTGKGGSAHFYHYVVTTLVDPPTGIGGRTRAPSDTARHTAACRGQSRPHIRAWPHPSRGAIITCRMAPSKASCRARGAGSGSRTPWHTGRTPGEYVIPLSSSAVVLESQSQWGHLPPGRVCHTVSARKSRGTPAGTRSPCPGWTRGRGARTGGRRGGRAHTAAGDRKHQTPGSNDDIIHHSAGHALSRGTCAHGGCRAGATGAR
jgi:hypothetical protein